MTGVLYCLKCKQKIEAESQEEADVLIDHGVSSIKCSGDQSYMGWYEGATLEGPRREIVLPTITTAATKKKSAKKAE